MISFLVGYAALIFNALIFNGPAIDAISLTLKKAPIPLSSCQLFLLRTPA
jgi:hypothetical protein